MEIFWCNTLMTSGIREMKLCCIFKPQSKDTPFNRGSKFYFNSIAIYAKERWFCRILKCERETAISFALGIVNCANFSSKILLLIYLFVWISKPSQIVLQIGHTLLFVLQNGLVAAAQDSCCFEQSNICS